MLELENKWLEWWNRVGARGDSKKTYSELVAKYSESHRFYHNLGHIAHCLDEFDQIKKLAEHPNELEIAIWYHDIIYDIRAKDNEEKSAQLAYKTLKDIKLSEEFAKRAHNLILSTQHISKSNNIDAKLIMDIDLSIFGKPSEEFNEYERRITKEYEDIIKVLSEKEFKVGRLGVLSNFLGRAYIYQTGFFRQKYEAQARENLERSLTKLGVKTIL